MSHPNPHEDSQSSNKDDGGDGSGASSHSGPSGAAPQEGSPSWDSYPPPPPSENRPAETYDWLLPEERAKALEAEHKHREGHEKETGCGSMAGGACLGMLITLVVLVPLMAITPGFDQLPLIYLAPLITLILGIIIAVATRYRALGWGIAVGPLILVILVWGSCVTLLEGLSSHAGRLLS